MMFMGRQLNFGPAKRKDKKTPRFSGGYQVWHMTTAGRHSLTENSVVTTLPQPLTGRVVLIMLTTWLSAQGGGAIGGRAYGFRGQQHVIHQIPPGSTPYSTERESTSSRHLLCRCPLSAVCCCPCPTPSYCTAKFGGVHWYAIPETLLTPPPPLFAPQNISFHIRQHTTGE